MSETVNDSPNILVRLKYYSPNGGGSQYAGRRALYASTIPDDYMRYIDKGITQEEKNGSDYMSYVDNGKKSAGVFGKDGILSKEQKTEIRKELRLSGSVIWDMVISFEEKYGDRYMRAAATAQALMKSQFNKFLKKAGLNPDNIVWFAGLHENTDNRHMHVCFFEKEPVYLRRGQDGKHFHHGKLRQTGIDGFKLGIEEYFSDTTMQLKTDRAELLTQVKEYTDCNGRLKKKISALAELLPVTGQLGYDSMNMQPLRTYVDGITNHIFKHHAPARNAYLKLAARLHKRDDEIRESCRRQKIKNFGDFLIHDKVVPDLYRRIGNHIINQAFNVRRRKDKDRQAKAPNASPKRRRIARRELLQSMSDCLKLKAIAEAECMQDFEDYLRRLEAAVPEPEYERQRQSEMEL